MAVNSRLAKLSSKMTSTETMKESMQAIEKTKVAQEIEKNFSSTQIDIDLLIPHPRNQYLNGMEEYENEDYMLKYSLNKFGNQGKIAVWKDKKSDKYIIVSGHRRVNSLRELGHKTIDCSILSDSLKEWEILQFLIIMNFGTLRSKGDDYHSALNAIEYKKNVLPYQQASIKDCVRDSNGELINGVNNKSLARVFSVSKTTIQKYLSLESMIPELQNLVKDKILTLSNAETLPSLDNDVQLLAYNKIIEWSQGEENTGKKIPRSEIQQIIANLQNTPLKGQDIYKKKPRKPRTSFSNEQKFYNHAKSFSTVLRKELSFEDKGKAINEIDEMIKLLENHKKNLLS